VSLVTVYSKPGCHLCEDAMRELRRLRPELGFELEERDILQDDALHRAYFERIPVVALDGEELCDYFLDESLLRERLAARPTEQPAGARDAGRPR
jgi:glutaredoxin